MDSIMRNRMVLGIAAIAVLITPVAVYAATSFPPGIRIAEVKTCNANCAVKKVDSAHLVTKASIPKNSGKAFGYGIVTGESVIVTTTHPGVLDSVTQHGDKNNPVFHNHYVHLTTDSACGGGDAVDLNALSFDSPGKLSIAAKAISLTNLPKTSAQPPLSQDNNVKAVVSFELVPKFDSNGVLKAVCVTNIHEADKVHVN